MSRFLQIAVDPRSLAGLIEDKRSWSDELVQCDPPRFIFGGIVLELRPLPEHVLRVLPMEFSDIEVALTVPEDVVLKWNRGALTAAEREAMRSLLRTVAFGAAPWVVVYEDASGDEKVEERVSPGDLFDRLDYWVTGDRAGLVTLVAVDPVDPSREELG